MGTDKKYTFRELTRRSWWVVIFSYATIFFSVLSIPGLLFDPDNNRFFIFNYVIYSEITLFFVYLPLVLYLLCFLIQLVSYLVWIFAAARNVRALGATNVPTGPVMVVIWHFIPVFMLWMPFLAMRDILKASISSVNWQDVDFPGYFHLWWVSSLISTMWANYSFSASNRGDPGIYEFIAKGDVAILPVDFLALWLTIRLVRHVTALQSTNHVDKVFE